MSNFESMEKITYGKSASSRIAAVLRMVNAKFNKRPHKVVEGKSEDAKAVWAELAYRKGNKSPQEENEIFKVAKATKHPLFFLTRMPYFIDHLKNSELFTKGVEMTLPQELINYFWANDMKALELIGENAPIGVFSKKPIQGKPLEKKAAFSPPPVESKDGGKAFKSFLSDANKKSIIKKKVAAKKPAAPKKVVKTTKRKK